MQLAIDVGNTQIVIGIFSKGQLKKSWRLKTVPENTIDEYELLFTQLFLIARIQPEQFTQAIVCSVVPGLEEKISNVIWNLSSVRALIINYNTPGVLSAKCLNPSCIGADRLVNATWVSHNCRLPCVALDFGTATTFDVVSREGVYEGGIIAPGLTMAAEALSNKAALLPQVHLSCPEKLIGFDTESSMLSGILHGYAALVEGLVEKISKELKSKEMFVVATGGKAEIIVKLTTVIKEVHPNLTLEGLRYIGEINK